MRAARTALTRGRRTSTPLLLEMAQPAGGVFIDLGGYRVAHDERGAAFVVRSSTAHDTPALARGTHADAPAAPQIFVIKIRLGAFAWTVYRRFTQFRTLGEQVSGSRMRWLAAALRALSYTRPLAAAAEDPGLPAVPAEAPAWRPLAGVPRAAAPGARRLGAFRRCSSAEGGPPQWSRQVDSRLP